MYRSLSGTPRGLSIFLPKLKTISALGFMAAIHLSASVVQAAETTPANEFAIIAPGDQEARIGAWSLNW